MPTALHPKKKRAHVFFLMAESRCFYPSDPGARGGSWRSEIDFGAIAQRSSAPTIKAYLMIAPTWRPICMWPKKICRMTSSEQLARARAHSKCLFTITYRIIVRIRAKRLPRTRINVLVDRGLIAIVERELILFIPYNVVSSSRKQSGILIN